MRPHVGHGRDADGDGGRGARERALVGGGEIKTHVAGEVRQQREARGVAVDYIRLDDPANTQSFAGEVARAVARHRPERIIATHPGEWRVLQDMEAWEKALGLPVEIRPDHRFICDLPRFRAWAKGRKQYRMEFFYREMRRETGLLMEGDEPAGGAWNYDAENRASLPAGVTPPAAPRFAPDEITRDVIALVEAAGFQLEGKSEINQNKKDPADQPPSFYVLGPGHSSDDDFDLVALLIPPGVSLGWGEGGEAAAISTGPRVVRVLEGQQLAVREAAPAAEGPATTAQAAAAKPATPATASGGKAAAVAAAPVTYQLSQPPFQVLARWEPQLTLPELSQVALDQERETAPVD